MRRGRRARSAADAVAGEAAAAAGGAAVAVAAGGAAVAGAAVSRRARSQTPSRARPWAMLARRATAQTVAASKAESKAEIERGDE